MHDSRGIEIVNFITAAALSAGTLMASAGTPYRLVPAHFYPWVLVYRGFRVRSPPVPIVLSAYQRGCLLDGLAMYLSCDTKKFHDNESTHILHNFWTSTHRGKLPPSAWRRHCHTVPRALRCPSATAERLVLKRRVKNFINHIRAEKAEW